MQLLRQALPLLALLVGTSVRTVDSVGPSFKDLRRDLIEEIPSSNSDYSEYADYIDMPATNDQEDGNSSDTIYSPFPGGILPDDARWSWHNDDDPKYADNSSAFVDFTPNSTDQTCTRDDHATPFNFQVRGTNLGGWLVLEPWITPSLFYQFLGTQARYGDQAPEKTGMDIYSFCTALGPEEANRQLRIHWRNWVTEDDIRELAQAGVNSLRIPVGDWMFAPYYPFIGCTDGSIDELDRVLDLCEKYGIKALIDIHGHIGSQNGFDNSGKTHRVQWTSIASSIPVGTTTFSHWPIRVAEWVGTWDEHNKNYSSINYNNLNQSLTVVTLITERYASHPAILGLQPVNEPWELTPIKVLKDFYWKSYKHMKAAAPHWKFVVHDSFRFGLNYWATFMKGCPDIALDTHIYQAWMNPGTKQDMYSNACQQKYTIASMEDALMPVIVGEWSLATDNCAMWLNGFNDNLPGFPKVTCKFVDCPINSTYLGDGFPGTPLDKNKPILGPYGTGTSGPSFGKCPVTTTAYFDVEDADFTHNLAVKKLNAFDVGHGWYFWNFKTEFTTKWSYLDLVRTGAFPSNVSDYSSDVENACEKEDSGDFICSAKRGGKMFEFKNALAFACNAPGIDCTYLNKTSTNIYEQCDWAFNTYWHRYREKGATCDFGGIAHLVETGSKSPITVAQPTNNSVLERFEDSINHHYKFYYSSILIVACVVSAFIGAALYSWKGYYLRSNNYAPIANERTTLI